MSPEGLRQATLCLLVKDDRVLLAMKKRGFGEGKWNGVGGKPNPGEDIEDAAVRETFEEIGVKPSSLKHTAVLNFYFPAVLKDKDWNQQVMVYIVDKWEGEPAESEEMAPKWFKHHEIPYDSMWPDDYLWLPKVLEGQFINADFYFDESQQISKFKLIPD